MKKKSDKTHRNNTGDQDNVNRREQDGEKLRFEEQRFRALAEQSSDIIIFVNREGIVTYKNPAVERSLGLKAEERIGVSIFERIHPDDLKFASDAFNSFIVNSYSKDINSPVRQIRLRHQDGSWRTFETAAIKLLHDNIVEAVIINLRDITERKKTESEREVALEALRKSQELYTKLVDTIPDSIVRTDLEGKILFVNDHTLQISGYKREEIEGQNILTFVSPEEHETMIKNVLLMIEHGLGPREYHLIMKDGRKILFEIHAEVLRNEDGTPLSIVSVCRDISERKRTEGILRENEERLRGITQNLPGIIFQFYAKDSGEYGVNYFSEPLGEFSEVIENIDTANLDTLFPSFLSRIHEEDRDRFLNSIMTAVETGTSWNFEGRVATMSGKIIWVQGLSTPTRHEDQLVFDGILLNITDRKKAEDDLRKSQESFRNYLEYAPDGVYMSDVRGTFLYGNRKSEEIIGYRREELIGKNFLELNILPEKSLNKAAQLLQANMEGISTGPDEIELIGKEGRLIPVEINTSVVQRMGQGIVLAFVRDITERKRAEEALKESENKYRLLADNIHDVVFFMDMNLNYTYISPSVKLLRGYEPEDAMKHTPVETVTPSSLDLAMRTLSEILEMEKSEHRDINISRTLQLEMTRKDGTTVWVETKASIVRDENQRPVGIMGVTRDITERKQAEDKLRKSEQIYRQLSIIDDLTQLYNSRHFYAQLEKEMERSNRYEQPLTILLLDLDKFKDFNDAYGHVEGDQVLLRLGQVVKRCLRETDSAYRYGGEEFTIILPTTTSKDGIVTAKRIQTELRKEAFSPVSGQEIYMTVSIGVAQYEPKEEMKAFVQRVDQLMYQAKRNGRDRICPESQPQE